MSLTDDQLAMRRTGITATDAVKLSGASPWGNANDVFADKVGVSSFEGNDATEIGSLFEPVVLGMVARRKGLLLTPGTTERSPVVPWALATPDANVMILPESTPRRVALVEAKVVGFRQLANWASDDVPPDYVVVQCAWQMAVTDTPLVYVAALLGTELRIFEVHRERNLEGALLELCGRFWNAHVVERKPPPPDGSASARAALQAVWPKQNMGCVSAPAASEDIARAWLEAHKAEKAAKAAKELATQQMCTLLGEQEGFISPNFKATWKYQEGCEVPAYTRQGGRVFRLTEPKGKP